MGGDKGLWVVEMRGIWTGRLMFSNSFSPLTKTSNKGPKMHIVVLVNKQALFASDVPGYIKAAACVYMCVFVIANLCLNRAEWNVHLCISVSAI